MGENGQRSSGCIPKQPVAAVGHGRVRSVACLEDMSQDACCPRATPHLVQSELFKIVLDFQGTFFNHLEAALNWFNRLHVYLLQIFKLHLNQPKCYVMNTWKNGGKKANNFQAWGGRNFF